MRTSAIVSALFAASVIAKPFKHHHKRDYVTEITWVTVTEYVYAGQEPTPKPAPPAHKHHSHPPAGYSKPAPPAPAPSSAEAESYPAPAQSSPAPVYSSPAPAPPAPAPSSAAPAPVSSKAPEPAPSSSKDASAPVGTGAPYETLVLAHHNVHRANHSAPDLVWNETLAQAAQTLASQCVFKHNTQLVAGGYGQNLAASAPNANVSAQITESWYNGEAPNFEPYYGQENPQVSDAIFDTYGHFSQMVWKDSTSVGCYTFDCINQNPGTDLKMFFTVCNYYPPGNFAGRWADNVIKPRGDKTCNWNDEITVS